MKKFLKKIFLKLILIIIIGTLLFIFSGCGVKPFSYDPHTGEIGIYKFDLGPEQQKINDTGSMPTG